MPSSWFNRMTRATMFPQQKEIRLMNYGIFVYRENEVMVFCPMPFQWLIVSRISSIVSSPGNIDMNKLIKHFREWKSTTENRKWVRLIRRRYSIYITIEQTLSEYTISALAYFNKSLIVMTPMVNEWRHRIQIIIMWNCRYWFNRAVVSSSSEGIPWRVCVVLPCFVWFFDFGIYPRIDYRNKCSTIAVQLGEMGLKNAQIYCNDT